MTDFTTLSRDIEAAHSGAFAGFAPQPVPAPALAEDAPVYRAALEACSALGFIAHDAQVLAHAWQARYERTGGAAPERWPNAPQDFGLRPRPHANAFAPCPHQLGLYAVLPDAAWVSRMARAGVPTVQLRFKSDDATLISQEVRAAVQAIAGTSALLFINDHWRDAIAAGAYGAHLGQEDLDALTSAEVQELRTSGLRLGVSTHGYAEMLRADAVQPSYIALGAVFPTTLKRMETVPQGVARLGAYAALLRDYPTVAIGGIGAGQFREILETRVGSVAVVRALVAAEEPEAEVGRLLNAMGIAAQKIEC